MELKIKVYLELTKLISEKISQLNADLKSARESSTADTKSSMGDKFETSREMIRQEIDFLSMKLEEATMMKNDLTKLNPQEITPAIRFGSLVTSSNGMFFISVPFGKLTVENNPVYAISFASPVGKLLMGKSAGDSYQLNGKEVKIMAVS